MSLLSRCCSSLLIGAVLLSMPWGVQAKNVAGISDAASTVSRGDFLRATVKALSLSLRNSPTDLPYQRVPAALENAVQIGFERNALGAFGDTLYLAQPISRGEALRIVVELQNLASPQAIPYRDVRRGTMEERAVKVNEKQRWLPALKPDYFGIQRRLTGAQAVVLLEALGGKVQSTPWPEAAPITAPVKAADPAKTQTIRVQVNGQTMDARAVSFPKADILQSIWETINDDYLYKEKIDENEAFHEALKALVKSLDDPYSRYQPPQETKNFNLQFQGEVSGIGAQVQEQDGQVVVVTPLTGSPAERAGVKPNDIITHVNDESLEGLEFIDAVDKIRGPKGSTVKLGIDREGVTLSLDVVRDVVQVPEIEISWHEDIAVVKLMQFGHRTENQLRDDLLQVQARNPRGIVLDVRNNPGGLLRAANVVLSNFLPQGSIIAVIKSQTNERQDSTSLPPTIDPSVPIVVLINNGSASASEIVAGALQDHDRAQVLGEKSFGKGTVQEVVRYSDESSLKLTIAEWFTPNRRKIDGEGIEPNLAVEYVNERDAPLLKALEILRSHVISF